MFYEREARRPVGKRMLTPADVLGKGVALLLMGQDAAGEEDWAVFKITRRTSKQVYLGAFSSGLAPTLRTSVDDFIDLDSKFFK